MTQGFEFTKLLCGTSASPAAPGSQLAAHIGSHNGVNGALKIATAKLNIARPDRPDRIFV